MQEKMEIQSCQGLSRKSRGILFVFKKSLDRQKIDLDIFVCKMFGCKRQSFKKKQFEQMIRKYDPKLIYGDIDQLFDQLDQHKNNIIFYYQFARAIKSITQSDDPKINALNQKSKIVNNQNEKNEFLILLKLKDLVLSFEDYLSIFSIFDYQKQGYLTKQSFTDLLSNFQFPHGNERTVLFQIVFKNRQKISIHNLLQLLQLQQSGSRINLDDFDLEKSDILEVPQSDYIKKKSQEHKQIQKQIIARSSSGIDGIVPIQRIPNELQLYFNYGSQLETGFSIIAKQFITNNAVFIDRENPVYSKAHNFVHLAEGMNKNYFLFQAAQSVIFRQKDRKGLGQLLEPKDIIQGRLGDCYFLSALAGIVQRYPQLVYKLFVLQKNPSHIYGVRLFIDGQWKTFTLDVCFPIDINGRFCGAQPHHQQIWVMLLQKAWAKAFKSYDNIHSGYNDEGLIAVSGAPCIRLSSKQNGFLKRIEVQIKKGAIITCATSNDVGQLTYQEQQKLGIYSSHAYTVINVFPDVKLSQSRKITLIKVRNPWGKNQWKGDWSYHSSKWTKQLKQKFNYDINPNDGSFFMSYDDFAIYFDHVHVCKVDLKNNNSHIQLKQSRLNYANTKFSVSGKGDYFFTIYQDNPRKYQKTFAYSKSKSWMYIGKITEGKIVAICSQTSIQGNNTIQVTLEKGEYVIITKVLWKYWDQHSYTISSYGPETLKFKKLQANSYELLSQWIQDKAHAQQKVSYYAGTKISKKSFFDPTFGYGFIYVSNQDVKSLQTEIQLENCQGIEVIQPYNLPIKLYVIPGQTIVVKFIVDAAGYKFVIKERFFLHKAF